MLWRQRLGRYRPEEFERAVMADEHGHADLLYVRVT
jgi:hypothetical protein